MVFFEGELVPLKMLGTFDVEVVESEVGVNKTGAVVTEAVDVMTRSLQFCIAGFLDFSSTRGMALPFRIKFAVLAALMVPPGRTPPGTDGLGLATKTPGIVDGCEALGVTTFIGMVGTLSGSPFCEPDIIAEMSAELKILAVKVLSLLTLFTLFSSGFSIFFLMIHQILF